MKRIRKYYPYLDRYEIIYWLFILSLAITGILILRYMTPYGLGMVNDSVGYIAGARNILAGNGYSRYSGEWKVIPITNFPPLFSYTIAFISLFGLEAIRASRLLILLCFAANIILFSSVARLLTKSKLFGGFSALMFIVLEPILRLHTYALTEPLYLVIMFLFFIASYFYLRYRRWYWIAICGILSCAAFLTRIIGATLFGVFILILIIVPNPISKRFSNFALYLLFALPGVVWWLVRNRVVSGNSLNRQLIYHPIEFNKIQEGINNFWNWIMPNRIEVTSYPSFIAVISFFILIILIYVIFTIDSFIKLGFPKAPQSSTDIFRMIIGIHGLGYLMFLFLSLTFFDSSSIFEDRIILPFMISLALIFITMIYKLWSNRRFLDKGFIIALLSLFIVIQIPDSVRTAKEFNGSGQGYLTWGWKNSETINVVSKLNHYAIYSNKPNAIYILADKPSYIITSPYNPATSQAREGYQETIAEIRKRVLAGEAIIVFFDYSYYKDHNNIQEYQWIFELTEGLPILEELYDGTIFGIAK